MKKILFLLTGADKSTTQRGYHKNLKLKSTSNSGRFFADYTALDDSMYDFLRQDGSSVLSKAMSMPMDELSTLIEQCRQIPPEDVKRKVDNYMTDDLEGVVDATYMNGSFLIETVK